ncbi:MAG: hypothetical protein MUF38_09440 [Anaerolineae bacterium]|jgi:hypothetical protein|nr:hypothetical protein [Anaerolineae bacterium]
MSGSKRVTSKTVSERGIWAFQERVSTLLFNWNAANIAVGLMAGRRGGFWRGFGGQAVGWGVINWAIAVVGSHFGRKRRAELPDPDSPAVFEKEKTNLRNILWVNWGLDLLYIWGGWRFLRGAKPNESVRAGTGAGIMVQGLLLFIFDSLMLREIAEVKPVAKRGGRKKTSKTAEGDDAPTD